MLTESPLSSHDDDNQGGGRSLVVVDNFLIGGCGYGYSECGSIEFLDFYDYDDIFVGINECAVLPDLEVDPELLSEFSPSGGEESSACCLSATIEKAEECNNSNDFPSKGEAIVSNKRIESVVVNLIVTPKKGKKGRKSSSYTGHRSEKKKKNNNNNPQAKRNVKVDWTPELHRRFVQAVEQLGVEKAVPSRILEIMGIHCPTRHNVASHLQSQKYRSHRKHLLARKAEAASWSQKQHLCGRGSSGGNKPRLPPNGFPLVAPPHPMYTHFQPLHVWGLPSVNPSLTYIWPKNLPSHHSPSPSRPLLGWAAAVPPCHTPWHPYQRETNAQTLGTPCYPRPTVFAAPSPPPFTGFPPHAMYNVDHPGFGFPSFPGQSASITPFDFQLSKETIDAAIGDVITKPWLPLPLGLKQPALEGVFGELHHQGVPERPLPLPEIQEADGCKFDDTSKP